MASKYDIRICGCGVIHFIPKEKIHDAITQDKELLWICGHCGNAVRIGADIEPNPFEDGPDVIYSMYSIDLIPNRGDQVLSIDEMDFDKVSTHKGYTEIFYSCGMKVPMKTGMHATMFNPYSGKFVDTWHPDYWKMNGPQQTVEDIRAELEKYQRDAEVINMHRLIAEGKPEYIEALARSADEAFNWDGTKMEAVHDEFMRGIMSDYDEYKARRKEKKPS